jgi:quercetin dioxygenase-like cupin family protein
MIPPTTLYRWEELPLEKITEMVARKAIVRDGLIFAQTYFKKGTVVPQHAHAEETVVYVLQGAVRFRVERDETTVREGEVLVIAAGAVHQAESLDDSFVLTVTAGS